MNLLILGHFGGSNLGDDAMLYAFLQQAFNNKCSAIRVISKNGNGDYRSITRQFNGVSFYKPRSFEVLRHLFWADKIILCGGTHYHDDYNNKRLKRHKRYLLKYNYLFRVARIFRKKVYLVANGIGPLRTKEFKKITRNVIQLSTEISVRDKTSQKLVTQLGGKEAAFGSDLAFLLEPYITSKKDANTLGISVMDLTATSYGDAETNTMYLESICRSIEHAIERTPQVKVKIIEIRGGERESDAFSSLTLYDAISKYSGSNVELIRYADDPVYMLNQINTCTTFLCTRYHSAVLATLCDCNTFFLAYHKKLIDLADDLKLGEKNVSDLSNKEEIKKLEAKLSEFLIKNVPTDSLINRDKLNELVKSQTSFIHKGLSL